MLTMSPWEGGQCTLTLLGRKGWQAHLTTCAITKELKFLKKDKIR